MALSASSTPAKYRNGHPRKARFNERPARSTSLNRLFEAGRDLACKVRGSSPGLAPLVETLVALSEARIRLAGGRTVVAHWQARSAELASFSLFPLGQLRFDRRLTIKGLGQQICRDRAQRGIDSVLRPHRSNPGGPRVPVRLLVNRSDNPRSSRDTHGPRLRSLPHCQACETPPTLKRSLARAAKPGPSASGSSFLEQGRPPGSVLFGLCGLVEPRRSGIGWLARCCTPTQSRYSAWETR
jgi:hypothetical protein